MTTSGPRMTLPTQAVLAALLERDGEELWGFELSRASGLAAGTIYPILARLGAAGWVVDRWEPAEQAQAQGRPPRRYHRLTAEGRARAVLALQHRAGRRSGVSRLLGGVPEPGR